MSPRHHSLAEKALCSHITSLIVVGNEVYLGTHKIHQIIQSDDYKYDLPDGKREYCKDGISCITAQGDDGEEVGITAYE